MADGAHEDEVVQTTQPDESTLARFQRFELAKRLIYVLYILAAYIPIKAVEPIARVLAGKDTNVTVTVTVSVAISLALGGGVAALMAKNRAQSKELVRLRARCERLEVELDAIKRTTEQ